jgi:phage repressor protein C with HTH and peptisase S24 domain
METNRNERLKGVIDYLKHNNLIYNETDFCNKVGFVKSFLSDMKNGKKQITEQSVLKVTLEFPFINYQWLLTGEGEMIKTQPFTAINNGTNNGVVGYNSGTINNTATPTIEEVDAEIIPYVDTALARKRNFNIAKAINNDSELLKQRTLDELFSPISFLIKMTDNSMTDEIRQGDMLFAKFIPKEANIVSGKIYLIDTNSYGTLVRQVYVNEDSFTLHAFNPSYEDIIITRDDIFNFCIVEHSLRSSFLIPDNTISTIAAESAKQVTKALTMLEKANERNEKLMELILNKL